MLMLSHVCIIELLELRINSEIMTFTYTVGNLLDIDPENVFIYGLTSLSLYQIIWHISWWMLNWKGRGKKRSRYHRAIFLEGLRKATKTLSHDGVPSEIRTQKLRNTCQNRYRVSQLDRWSRRKRTDKPGLSNPHLQTDEILIGHWEFRADPSKIRRATQDGYTTVGVVSSHLASCVFNCNGRMRLSADAFRLLL
jgi:hypothetical protein